MRYRVGASPWRAADVDPGAGPLVVRLNARARTVAQPPDPSAGFRRIAATQPFDALITKATEPQTIVARVHLALAAVGGEGGTCVLVASTVRAATYPHAAGR